MEAGLEVSWWLSRSPNCWTESVWQWIRKPRPTKSFVEIPEWVGNIWVELCSHWKEFRAQGDRVLWRRGSILSGTKYVGFIDHRWNIWSPLETFWEFRVAVWSYLEVTGHLSGTLSSMAWKQNTQLTSHLYSPAIWMYGKPSHPATLGQYLYDLLLLWVAFWWCLG